MSKSTIQTTVLLIILLSSFSLVLTNAKADANPAGSLETLSGQRQEIQLILKLLASSPQFESVKKNRLKLKTWITTTKEKISSAEKEISQLKSALKGVDESSKEGILQNGPLSSLVSLRQQKELELVELRLLLTTLEEAVKQLDLYIGQQQTKNTFYRNQPLWSVFFSDGIDSISTSEKTQAAELQHSSVTLVLFLSLLAASIFILSFNPAKRIIAANSSQKNIVGLLVADIAGSSRFAGILAGMLIVSAVSAVTLLPELIRYTLLSQGILALFYCSGIYIFIKQMIPRFTHLEGDEPRVKVEVRKNTALLFFSMTSGLVMSIAPRYLTLDVLALSQTQVSSLLMILWFAALYPAGRSVVNTIAPTLWQYTKYAFVIAPLLLFSLEFFGYRNLVDSIAVMFKFSAVILGTGLIIYDSIDVLIALLGTYREKLLDNINLKRGDDAHSFRALTILGIGLKIYVILATFILLLQQLGLTNVDNERLREIFFHGIDFSGFTVSPIRIGIALLLLVICWPTIGYIKQIIERTWLSTEGFSPSSRDTILTLSGYLGYSALTIILLAIAGVRLTGITVVVGALSIGIGFGLQNIVNNFISGLILMFERPIKKGDWILVGSTEGYVKKISIRSTIVQTFDRADVIVPNSELIANQVTNMMFDDHRGRLRVSVGVAYGSDTECVQKLLLEIGRAHDQVITDGSAPPPRVYFQAFGDSSLNFDLLCHLRDIDEKIRVRSELHLSIDKAFRKNGIEIPFPQRDVHIKKTHSS